MASSVYPDMKRTRVPGWYLLDPIRKLPAAQLRHHHVGEQQVGDARAVVQPLEGFLSVSRRQDGVSVPLEDGQSQLPQRFVVFHEEDGLRSIQAIIEPRVPTFVLRRRLPGHTREVDLHHGSRVRARCRRRCTHRSVSRSRRRSRVPGRFPSPSPWW